MSGQAISADGPGTILRDIETLLDFIGERGVPTKSKNGNLPSEVLPLLNARLAHPIQVPLDRALLQHYPNVAGLFILLRVMELARADAKRVWIDSDALQQWREFNPVERYFALLEAWLCKADADVPGRDANRPPGLEQFPDNVSSLVKLTMSQWKTFSADCHSSRYSGAVSTWNTQLQIRFGLIEVKPRGAGMRRGSEGRGWIMEKARRTPWGTAVAWAIVEAVLQAGGDDEYALYHTPENAGFGFLQAVFQPFFPAWQKAFASPGSAFRPGTYVFKVAMTDFRAKGDVWRRLAVPDGADLYDMAVAVVQAFGFEHDHAHLFRYRDRLGRGRSYIHPDCDEGPFTTEIVVGEADLPEKGVMDFEFDFGDSWQFELRLERLDPPGKKHAPIMVIDSAGQPPEQYPKYE